MPYGLYISADGAAAQSKRLEVVANNLANVDTPGFKRDLAVFQARYAEAVQQGLDYSGSQSINNVGGGVKVQKTETDYSPGPLRHTGSNTEMAIQADGFFVVQKGNKMLLTRAGNFSFDDQGQLVTPDGDPVMSDGGTPVTIDPDAGPWQITHDGGIAQAGSTTLLAMVKPASMGDLAKQGGNMFLPLGPTQPLEDGDRQVAGGFVEQSAVQPTLEMMEMIEASRAFEANVNMIRTHDQAIGTLVDRVLRNS